MSDQSADEAAETIVQAIKARLEDHIRWHLRHGSEFLAAPFFADDSEEGEEPEEIEEE